MTPQEMYEIHDQLHTLWTRAVGTQDYNRKDWGILQNLIDKAMDELLGTKHGGWLAEVQNRLRK